MTVAYYLPSGYLTVCHGKSPFLRTVNHLFLWAIYTMAMLVITRGYFIGHLFVLFRFPADDTPNCCSANPRILRCLNSNYISGGVRWPSFCRWRKRDACWSGHSNVTQAGKDSQDATGKGMASFRTPLKNWKIIKQVAPEVRSRPGSYILQNDLDVLHQIPAEKCPDGLFYQDWRR